MRCRRRTTNETDTKKLSGWQQSKSEGIRSISKKNNFTVDKQEEAKTKYWAENETNLPF